LSIDYISDVPNREELVVAVRIFELARLFVYLREFTYDGIIRPAVGDSYGKV